MGAGQTLVSRGHRTSSISVATFIAARRKRTLDRLKISVTQVEYRLAVSRLRQRRLPPHRAGEIGQDNQVLGIRKAPYGAIDADRNLGSRSGGRVASRSCKKGIDEMDEIAPAIRIGKMDAAHRQLKAAIRLWFADEDPVAVHTLAAASHEIILALFKKSGLSGLLFDSEDFKAEHREKIVRAIKSRRIFLNTRIETQVKYWNSSPD
jgi:hypothetical protein